jgi:hypothetical protein
MKPIQEWVWVLKEDGTHDKWKAEKVVFKKEGSDEEVEEKDATLICNEKLY